MKKQKYPKIDVCCTLRDPKLISLIEEIYKSGRGERIRMGAYLLFDKLLSRKSPSLNEYAKRTEKMCIALSRERAEFAYILARSINAKKIVEFGTSFGLSTIYLAAAVKDNGGGIVIGSEIVENKMVKAVSNLEKAGLSEFVEIRLGDATTTLSNIDGKIDMLLLDGHKDYYIPILSMLYPLLRRGAVVLGDNVTTPFMKESLASYVDYVTQPTNGFFSVTIPYKDGIECSIKL